MVRNPIMWRESEVSCRTELNRREIIKVTSDLQIQSVQHWKSSCLKLFAFLRVMSISTSSKSLWRKKKMRCHCEVMPQLFESQFSIVLDLSKLCSQNNEKCFLTQHNTVSLSLSQRWCLCQSWGDSLRVFERCFFKKETENEIKNTVRFFGLGSFTNLH